MSDKPKAKVGVVLRSVAPPVAIEAPPPRLAPARSSISRKLTGALTQLAAAPRPPRRFPTD
jgi:hypothetical protein